MRTLAALAFVLIAGSAPGADWPMRGGSPTRNPVSLEKNAPSDWQIETEDAKPRNIKWSAQLGSRSHGGPVVSGGLVWVGTNNEKPLDPKMTDDRSVLACFRESDGKFLSQYAAHRIGDDLRDWPKRGLSGSPLIEGDRIWFCNSRKEIVCLDVEPLRTGKGRPREVWTFDMVKELKLDLFDLHIPGHDTHGSPAAYKDFLYVPTGNGINRDPWISGTPNGPTLVCLRKDTGKLVWKVDSPGPGHRFGHYASPLVVEIGGKVQAIHPQGDGWVRSFDAETGKLLWKFDPNPVGVTWIEERRDVAEAEVVRNCVMGAPVYANGRVYFAHGCSPEAGGGPGRLFCIDPTKAGDVSPELDNGKGKGKPNPNSALVWDFEKVGMKKTNRIHQSISPVAVHDGFVIATDFYGIVHCLDEKTGQRHWSHDTKTGQVYGGPLVADGKIYVGTSAGDVWVFELAKAKKLLAKNEFNQGIIAPPVFANGVLYVLTEAQLYAIGRKP